MKLLNKTELLVLAKSEQKSEKTGNVFYKLVCMQNGEVFESNVPVEVYNSVKEQTPYVFVTQYVTGRYQNEDYQYFRITGLAKSN